MNSKINLRQAVPEDLPEMARVHVESFPDSALTKLGPKTVELYYRWQFTGPHEKVRATVAIVDDECAGFSFSGIFRGSTSGFVNRYKTHLVLAVLRRPQLLFNGLFFRRLIEGIRLISRLAKKRNATPKINKAERAPDYGILAIAVAPRFQKLGIGQRLMLDAEEEAVRYGSGEICLTVHPDNRKAVRFYERQNWKKSTTASLWNGAMIKTLEIKKAHAGEHLL